MPVRKTGGDSPAVNIQVSTSGFQRRTEFLVVGIINIPFGEINLRNSGVLSRSIFFAFDEA